MDVYVKWTGSWPRRCKGRWIFEVDGKDYRYLLPFANDDGYDLPADTYNTYEHWEVIDGEEEWCKQDIGLDIEDWEDQNREWLEIISEREEDWDDIFYAFQEADWRFKSCGGCGRMRLNGVSEHKTGSFLDIGLNIDDEVRQYCTGKESRNQMGITGVQYHFRFPNGYGASVIKCYGSYGWNMNLWEVGLVIEDDLIYVNDFEWDVIGNLDDDGVNALLHKVINYEAVTK